MGIEEREIRLKEAKLRRVRTLRIRIAVVIAVILLIIAACAAYFSKNSTASKETSAQKQTEKESSAQKQSEKDLTDAELLQNYYDAFLSENGLSAAKKDISYAEWFYENYPAETVNGIIELLKSNTLDDSSFYQFTGESIHVSSDRYQEVITADNRIFERSGVTSGEAMITLAGDVCLEEDKFVLDYYDKVNDLTKCISPDLLEIMNSSDVMYLNTEFCISDRGTAQEDKSYTYRAKPERVSLLTEMGADLVSLSNDHIYDYGPDAMMDTCDLLIEAEIAYIGGGKNLSDAERPVYFIVNGIKIGFVGASNAEKTISTPDAGENSPGIISAYDTASYNAIIQNASKNCDYLIAYIHWGSAEETNNMNDQQKANGREFLASGADIVIGGHPHYLQGMEYVDGKPIVYSLGDFWFDSDKRYSELLTLKINIDGLQEMNIIPCQMADSKTQYISNVKEQEEYFTFLEEISVNAAISSEGVVTPK
ncbi:MAG: CapA family protein [Schaedlerella sp.]|nr:CapA family protein [Schaedlerella sp.]